MNKEFLWDNKERIIKKLYIVLGILLIMYLIINFMNTSDNKLTLDTKNFHSTSSKVSSEYIPAEIAFT